MGAKSLLRGSCRHDHLHAFASPCPMKALEGADQTRDRGHVDHDRGLVLCHVHGPSPSLVPCPEVQLAAEDYKLVYPHAGRMVVLEATSSGRATVPKEELEDMVERPGATSCWIQTATTRGEDQQRICVVESEVLCRVARTAGKPKS